MDTDSFIFHVETDDIYSDMKEDCHLYDFSDYPKSSPLYSVVNKKVPAKFKDELNGKVISKFCGLRSKMYAISYREDGEDIELGKSKGVSKATIEKELCLALYEATLFDKTEILSSMDIICSRSHKLFCEKVRKTLSCFDDKRWLFDDGVSSLAYVHYSI